MSRSKSAVVVDDIWAKLDQDETVPVTADGESNDLTVLFVGDSGSGKSSLLQSFLKPNVNKDPKPTFALEYNFIRKKQVGTTAASKSVSHIWELGGDIFEPKLLEMPLAQKNITGASVAICVDMSQPENIVPSLLKWLSYVKDIVNRRMHELQDSSQVSGKTEIVTVSYGTKHPDKLKVNPSYIPIYIMLTKYDLFRSRPSVECKMALQAVRLIAHYHGASVLSCSTKDLALRDNFRSVFNAICFNQTKNAIGTLSVTKIPYEVAGDRPNCVRVGKDSFSAIFGLNAEGQGQASGSSLIRSESDVSLYLANDNVTKDCWHRLNDFMKEQFGQPSANTLVMKEVFIVQTQSAQGPVTNNHLLYEITRDVTDESTDARMSAYAESEVDAMRAQRDVQLNLYIQEAHSKEQLNKKLNQSSAESTAEPTEKNRRSRPSKDARK